MAHKPGIGAIFGITAEDGAASQKRVALIDRANLGRVLAVTTADVNGGYVFKGLNPDYDGYLALSVDDDGAPPKDALIEDYIQPVPAYQGAEFQGNYVKLVMSADPLSGWFGLTDAHGDHISPIDGRGTALSRGTNVNWAQPSICPGAPQLGSIELDNAAFGHGCRRMEFELREQPFRGSLEWAFRRSSVSTSRMAQLVMCGYADTNDATVDSENGQLRGVLALRYDPSTQILKLFNYSSTGTNNYSGPFWGWREIISFDLSAMSDDVHVIATCEYANEANLYVNGQLEATSSLAGQNSYVGSNYNRGFAGLACCGEVADVGSYRPTGRFTTLRTGPAFFYQKVLSAADALAHYEALMTPGGGSPLETGYAKELILEQPIAYFRMSDPNELDGLVDWLRPDAAHGALTIVNAADVSFSEPSPVAGQTGIEWGGNSAARSNYVGSNFCSERSGGLSVILQPANAAPAQIELIARLGYRASTYYFELIRDTTGAFAIRLRESGSLIEYTFPTIVSNAQKHLFSFGYEKTTQEAFMMVDGVVIDTIPINATIVDTSYNDARVDKTLHVAGVVNDAFSSVTYPYAGYMSDLVLFPIAPPISRLQAHYAALSTV